MIKITVNTRQAILEETELLTTNSVGISVQFTFSEDWNGLSKVAVFRAGEESEWYDLVVGEDNTVDIPWELMTDEFEGEPLFIGAFGETAADHVIAIPTIWVSVGAIKPGARSGNAESADPTPTQWSQIRMLATTAAEDAESAQQSAESAQYYAEHGPIIQDNYWYTWNGSEYVSTGQKAVGEDGDPGEDGVSPLVSVSEIESGHHIEITDAESVSTFNVMDGKKGDTGDIGPSGIAVQPTEPLTSVLVWMDTSNASVASVPTTAELTTVDDKVGDGVLVGFDPLDNDLTKATNSLKNTLTQLETNVGKILPVITGSTNNSGYTINTGDYFEANGALYKATASIPIDGAWSSSAAAQTSTAVNDLKNAINGTLYTATVNGLTYNMKIAGSFAVINIASGANTNAISGGDVLVSLSDFTPSISGEVFVMDTQALFTNGVSGRFSTIRNTGNVVSNVVTISAGTSLRGTIVCAF